MTKGTIRKIVIQRIKNDSHYDYAKLYHRLFTLKQWQQAQIVAVTISTPIEIPTQPIIYRAWQMGKQVVVPKTLPHRKMIFDCYNQNTELQHDQFGILEPVEDRVIKKNRIDLVVVPGLAFTKSGVRLGFGGGYYDRYLRSYQGFTVALARPSQIYNRPMWPVSHYDVKIDKIISG